MKAQVAQPHGDAEELENGTRTSSPSFDIDAFQQLRNRSNSS